MFEAIVYDDRDRDAEEPSSSLGFYKTEQEAELAIERYLRTEHGVHIYNWQILEN